jgi:glutamate racemase
MTSPPSTSSGQLSSSRNAALGVFDSGLGGLSVVRALRKVLPNENIVYLGDTARVPYGTKGKDTVTRYALACARYLQRDQVKAIVVACNTVSAVAPAALRAELDLPILGVIEPGAKAAVLASKSGRIGVLATSGTVASGAYPRAIASCSTRAETFAVAAPLLVPLAEEGWTSGELPTLAVRRYLEPLAAAKVDVVVLGCTHYPILRAVIQVEASRMMQDVTLVDSGEAAAADIAQFLRDRALTTTRTEAGSISVRVTDLPGNFRELASRFLAEDVSEVKQVDL